MAQASLSSFELEANLSAWLAQITAQQLQARPFVSCQVDRQVQPYSPSKVVKKLRKENEHLQYPQEIMPEMKPL